MSITATKKSKNAFLEDKYSFILLCDFAGHRLKTPNLYAPLLEYKISLLDKQIKLINKKFKNNEILLCVGLESAKLIKYVDKKYPNQNIRIIENVNYLESNSCESLRLALNNTYNRKLIVIDSSMEINARMLNRIKTDSCYAFVSNSKDGNADIGANITKNKQIEYFSFGGCQRWKEMLVLCDEKTIWSLKNILLSGKYRRKFIFEALNDLIMLKHEIRAIEVKDSTVKTQKVRKIK
tara:strand:- start:6456 stop:7166 length:711 start_codon:yes stop_codon:yes gene_type:complete